MAQSSLDQLQPADATTVARLLEDFWRTLAMLPDLIRRREHLLAANTTVALRQTELELMLALNGFTWPLGVTHLNAYLGESQRAAIEKTLLTPAIRAESWIGQAVALVVIYRWYAPQLVEKFALVYPHELEETTLTRLQELSDWPLSITTG